MILLMYQSFNLSFASVIAVNYITFIWSISKTFYKTFFYLIQQIIIVKNNKEVKLIQELLYETYVPFVSSHLNTYCPTIGEQHY